MKSQTLLDKFNEWVSEGILGVSDKDFLVNRAISEATMVANSAYGLPPKKSNIFPTRILQGTAKKHREKYEQELTNQLEWRYKELRKNHVLTYDNGVGKERTISLNQPTINFSF